MRGRTLGAFGLGFAAGCLCLGIGLWAGGALTLAHRERALPQPPFDLNSMVMETRSLPPAGGTVTPPIDYAQPPGASAVPSLPPAPRVAPTATGDASRFAPDAPPQLSMPIAGISPKTVTDTFESVRGNHKHEALDIMAPRGTPVLAVDEGNVVKLFTSKDGGLTVYQFNDARTYCYYYAHLDRYARNLKEGTLLRRGDVLGYVGSTGDAAPDAPHLHFAVFKLGPEKKWWEGTPMDPLPFLQ
jgi:murein DD-endopeptidase MepM/ murein hydrolase activator NlpD